MTEPSRPDISIIVPVYRAESCLDELYERLERALGEVAPNFEIILVNDGSPDASWDVIRRLAKADPRVKGLELSRNFGQHRAITAGMDACTGDWVVVMDCDLQDRPEDIPALLARAREGWDIVVARRETRSGDSFLKRLQSRVYYRLFWILTGIRYDEGVGNFRIMERKVVEAFQTLREEIRFFAVLVEWLGFRVTSVNVDHDARSEGRSTYNLRRLAQLALNGLVAYSNRPINFTIVVGLGIGFVAFVIGCSFLYLALFQGVSVSGWASTIVSLYFIGGLLLANMGIIGLYLGKTFNEVRNRPLYIVRSRTDDPDPPRATRKRRDHLSRL